MHPPARLLQLAAQLRPEGAALQQRGTALRGRVLIQRHTQHPHDARQGEGHASAAEVGTTGTSTTASSLLFQLPQQPH